MKSTQKYKQLVIIISTIICTLLVITTRKTITQQTPQIKETPFKDLASTQKIKIPILMYHYVENVTDERDFIRESLNIPPHIFEAQITTLKNAGYIFITPQEIPKILQQKQNTDKKYVIISFDDGYEDFYTDAFPIIKKHNVKAINYIVYNYIGQLNYMESDQIKEIIKSKLVEIGSHTVNHAYLKDIDQNMAFAEILNSKDMLEKTFGVEVKSFAYPYGVYDTTVKKLVIKAGYTTAVTVETGNTVSQKTIFEVPRVRPGHLVGENLLRAIDNPTSP